jgi:hypothetical protein
VGAVGQITAQGLINDVFPVCFGQDTGGTYRAVCRSAAFPRASHLQYTIFDLPDGNQVSLAIGYYGEVDLAQFPELQRVIPQSTATEEPTPIPEPTFELSYEIEVPGVATPINQSDDVYDISDAFLDVFEIAENNGQLGNSVTEDDTFNYFFASVEGDTSFMWQRGDWLYMVSAPSTATLTAFLETLPF